MSEPLAYLILLLAALILGALDVLVHARRVKR